MKENRENINYGLFGKILGGCLPANRLNQPTSQKELLDKMTTISRIDQEKFIKTSIEGGCVQTTFDEDKSKFEFKYASKIEMINHEEDKK